MEYAIIESGGKQYKVSEGTIIDVDNLHKTEGSFVFENVLLHVSGADITFGMPFIEGLSITGKVLGPKKGEKIRVSKFKSKARYRKSIGFRAQLTSIEITSIGGASTSKKAAEKKS